MPIKKVTGKNTKPNFSLKKMNEMIEKINKLEEAVIVMGKGVSFCLEGVEKKGTKKEEINYDFFR